LEYSLDEGCRVYLKYLWEQRVNLAVWHPWTEDACWEMGIG